MKRIAAPLSIASFRGPWQLRLAALALCGGAALFASAMFIADGPRAVFNARAGGVSVPAKPVSEGSAARQGQLRIPPADAHMDDLRLLNTIAGESEVTLGSIGFRAEPAGSLPVVIRSLDLSLQDDYPRFKAFVARVLKELPNAYVEKIQMEQPNAASPKVQFSLRLSLVYQTMSEDALDIDALGVTSAVAAIRPQMKSPLVTEPTAETVPAAQLQLVARLDEGVVRNPFGALDFNEGGGEPPAAPRAPAKPAQAAGSFAPVAVAATLPPTPVAPPLPFTAIGAIQGTQVTEGRLVAFIARKDELLVVKAGDVIARTYKVEAVTPQKIDFTYLPMMQRQSLTLAP